MGEFIMNYVISTDACADMPVGYEKEHDIPIVPMPYSLKMPKGTLKKLDFIGKANTEFDIVECRTDTTGFIQNMKKFFDTLRAGAIPKTSQSNAEITFETLEPYVKAGNDVLHIAFSSGMSGSFNSACIAATELMEKYPGRTVKVVDSLGGVGGEGLCVMDAVKLRDEGVSIEDAHKNLPNTRRDIIIISRSATKPILQEAAVSRASNTCSQPFSISRLFWDLTAKARFIPPQRSGERKTYTKSFWNCLKPKRATKTTPKSFCATATIPTESNFWAK